jgi:flagellar biosynthetic protein FliR
MDALFNSLLPNSLVEFTGRQLLSGALVQFHAFTLVVVRLSGLMTTAPAFSSASIPVTIRVLLVITLGFLITPTLPRNSDAFFQNLDVNRDARLERAEVPAQLTARFDELLSWAGKPPDATLESSEFRLAFELPATLLDFLWIGIGEFSLGLVLGLGAMTVLSSLQLTGQLFDQQTGVGLGEVFNPDLNMSTSLTGDLLYLLGTTVFLVLGGHLLLVTSLAETFRTLPLGHAYVAGPTIEFLSELVHHSLSLALQVGAPILATMSIVALAMGFLGQTVPQLNVLNVGFPIRVLVGLGVLGLALSGMAATIAQAVPDAVQHLRQSLTS